MKGLRLRRSWFYEDVRNYVLRIILTHVHFLQGESKWKYRHNYYTENMGLFNWQSFVDIYFWITNIRNYLLVRDLEQRFYGVIKCGMR